MKLSFDHKLCSISPGSIRANTWCHLRICLVALLLMVTNAVIAQEKSHTEISPEGLIKKWTLDQYKFLFYTEAPSQEEVGDYLQLNADRTFTSVSEGEMDTGKWQLDAAKRSIFLFDNQQPGGLTFIIHALSKNRLVLVLDDPSDPEARYLKIHFIAQ